MKIELLEVSGWKAALKGMRNPLESWSRLDSVFDNIDVEWEPGEDDKRLALTLTRAGSSHRKFLRFPSVYLDVTSYLRFWDQLATYKFVDCNSTSSMHKLGKTDLTVADFDTEGVSVDGVKAIRGVLDVINLRARERNQYLEAIAELNKVVKPTGDAAIANRERKAKLVKMADALFQEINKLNPQGYLYTRTLKLNYEVLIKMYSTRKNHKLEEWRIFCSWIRENIPFLDEILTQLEEKYGNKHGM